MNLTPKFRSQIIGFFCVCASLALLGPACSKNRVHSTSKENAGDDSIHPTMKRLEFQGDLKNHLSVAGVNQAKVSGDLPKVQIRLENQKDSELNLSYKVEWLDEDGMVVGDSSLTWSPLLVRGGETVAIQAVAVSSRAKNFNLKIQRAKNP